MVDAVDGVTVCIPEAVDDPEHDIYFEAGTQELRGQQALNYVRERSQLSANSDIGRMKRQQAFIASMINKVISANTLTKPYRVYNFIEAATTSITPDPELASLHKLATLARQFRNTDLDDIEFITVPFMSYEPDPNRLIWAPEADELWERIIADKPLNKKLSGQVVTASDPVGGSPVPVGRRVRVAVGLRYAGWRRRRDRDRERAVRLTCGSGASVWQDRVDPRTETRCRRRPTSRAAT